MIFFGKKKRTALPDLGWLQTDMHSHLVPAIDDGSQDLETSIHLIQGMQELGYRKLITTPHILWDMYPNTPEIISAGISELRKEAAIQTPGIELHAAAEYFIDSHFQQLLQTRTPLLPLKNNLVLVEFSMVTESFDLMDMLFEMQLQNYQPVIAHPERYLYLKRKTDFFDELKNAGCYFQLNLLSLSGHYGSSVLELADFLVRKDYYDYVGTDLHHARHLEGLKKIQSPLLQRLKDSGVIKNHLL